MVENTLILRMEGMALKNELPLRRKSWTVRRERNWRRELFATGNDPGKLSSTTSRNLGISRFNEPFPYPSFSGSIHSFTPSNASSARLRWNSRDFENTVSFHDESFYPRARRTSAIRKTVPSCFRQPKRGNVGSPSNFPGELQ